MEQTFEQKRASFALNKIKSRRDSTERDAYARFVQRLPEMVLNNGLGQALAFLLADNEGSRSKPSGALCRDLGEWLITKRGIYHGEADNLIELLIAGDRHSYQYATEEALALLTWMSRFADAFLKSEEVRP